MQTMGILERLQTTAARIGRRCQTVAEGAAHLCYGFIHHCLPISRRWLQVHEEYLRKKSHALGSRAKLTIARSIPQRNQIDRVVADFKRRKKRMIGAALAAFGITALLFAGLWQTGIIHVNAAAVIAAALGAGLVGGLTSAAASDLVGGLTAAVGVGFAAVAGATTVVAAAAGAGAWTVFSTAVGAAVAAIAGAGPGTFVAAAVGAAIAAGLVGGLAAAIGVVAAIAAGLVGGLAITSVLAIIKELNTAAVALDVPKEKR